MSINRRVDKDVVHMYDGILFGHKKNEIMSFAATWMELEIIILSKSERERQILYDITYLWNLTKNDTNELIYKTEIDSQTWKTITVTKGERDDGRDKLGA